MTLTPAARAILSALLAQPRQAHELPAETRPVDLQDLLRRGYVRIDPGSLLCQITDTGTAALAAAGPAPMTLAEAGRIVSPDRIIAACDVLEAATTDATLAQYLRALRGTAGTYIDTLDTETPT
jgi:hypothetical protein